MAQKIAQYAAAWHAGTNRGAIRLVLANGKKEAWRGKYAAEFTAILTILEASKTPYLTKNGWIATTNEEPGV